MKKKLNIKNIKRVLITGISGSGGSYLAEYISTNHKKIKIYGIARWHSTSNNDNLKNIIKKVKIFECDLNDFSSIYSVLKKTKPDIIFHLASFANVRASFDNPNLVLSNNITGTCNLLESVKLLGMQPIIQICSTSEVYGQVLQNEVPIKESAPLRPASPYAVSKVAQDLLGRTYYKSYGLKIIITRMFSYLNPRRTDLFATSFAKQIAWIESGLTNTLYHGNLNSVRTMIDVRDAMRAYWEAILYCDFGEAYNIGGNTRITVGEFLEKLISLSRKKIPTKLKKSLLRPTDVTLQIPAITKFKNKTGFSTKYSFDQSLEDLLDYWRIKARKEVYIRKKIN
tara:strand:+ start:464 stop:1483 length:1020 start_codon:yes stop_codon:yes gene_type:complete